MICRCFCPCPSLQLSSPPQPWCLLVAAGSGQTSEVPSLPGKMQQGKRESPSAGQVVGDGSRGPQLRISLGFPRWIAMFAQNLGILLEAWSDGKTTQHRSFPHGVATLRVPGGMPQCLLQHCLTPGLLLWGSPPRLSSVLVDADPPAMSAAV